MVEDDLIQLPVTDPGLCLLPIESDGLSQSLLSFLDHPHLKVVLAQDTRELTTLPRLVTEVVINKLLGVSKDLLQVEGIVLDVKFHHLIVNFESFVVEALLLVLQDGFSLLDVVEGQIGQAMLPADICQFD